MTNAASLFTRVLADLFPGKSAARSFTPSSTPSPSPSSGPSAWPAPDHTPAPRANSRVGAQHEVGQGAPNETLVTIGDTPHLFVDEGDHIVEFVPAFDDHTEETEFGVKIVPDLAPHWAQVSVHRCGLKVAIAAAIRQGNSPVPKAAVEPTQEAPGERSQTHRVGHEEPVETAASGHVRRRRPQAADASMVTGRIASWGEESFPDRNKPGRFYKSFAMHIDTSAGERTLQGEGLKEAIAECRCVVGDVVSVRRLRKVKVPAIRGDGSPIMVEGKQLMWDKWLWSITK